VSGLRAFVLAASVVLFLLCVLGVLASAGDPSAASAAWTGILVFGAVAVLVVLERQRYRSAAAERGGPPPGPGGGEEPDGRLEARFRPTDERFVDPPSGRRMRVWVDPASGERRYVAEG
jgi:hypothetical protein